MPSFCFSAVVRTADPTLLLDITHFLVQNSPSETIHKVRGNVPENVDVLLASDLVITLSGTLDHVKIPSADIAKSTVTLHFKRYLETNAGQLGLDTVSNIYIDEDDDIPKFFVTSVRSVPQETRHPHATLLSIDIIFRWKSSPSKKGVDEEINLSPDSNSVNHTNPFSSPLLLPSQAILNTIIEKFVSVHLVKRYPLIFGLWRNKLDMEISFFTPIARAITNILERSSNDTLAKQGNRLIKHLRVQNIRAFDTSSVTLFNYLQTSGLIHSNDEEQMLNFHITNQEVICMTMERLFKNGVPRSRFKGSTSIRSMTADTDDFHEFNLNQSSSASAMQADWSQGQDMALLWDDLALSSAPGTFPIIPAQDDRRHEPLKHHNIDEYLDDEGEWTQDGEGGWDWQTFRPLMPLDFDKNEAEPNDLEGFSPESSQDLLLTPPLSLSQSHINPHIIDDYQQISADVLDHDRHSDRMGAKSQDCGAEFIDPLNTSEYTNSQGQRSKPIAKEQRLLSEAQSISYDVGSISDTHSVLRNDAPEIFFADEIHLGGDGFVCTTGTFNHLQSGNDMEAPNTDPRSRAWEWGLLDFDM